MSKVYVQIPEALTFDLADPGSGEPMFVHDQVGSYPEGPIMMIREPREPAVGTFAGCVRALFVDPRVAEGISDGYELMGARHALTRAEPGDIVELSTDVHRVLRDCILKPHAGFSKAWLWSGGLDLLRCIVDATTAHPKKVEAQVHGANGRRQMASERRAAAKG